MIGRSLSGRRCAMAVVAAGALLAIACPARGVERGEIDRQIGEALHREVYGLYGEKQAMLQEILAAAPDSQAARWHLGYVKQGGQWVKPAAEATSAENDPRLAGYCHRRAAADDTAEAQSDLAEWCERRGLQAQSRAHWTRVVQLAPDHPVARRELGFVRIGLNWVHLSELEASQERSQRRQADLAKHQTDAARLLKRLVGRSDAARAKAIEDIASLDRTDWIAALEMRIAPHSEQAAAAAVTALGNMTDPEAMEALARIAIFSPWQATRLAAAEKLTRWPIENYVPSLLAEMYMPLESRTIAVNDGRGRLIHRHVFQREGQQQHEQLVLDTAYRSAGGNPASVYLMAVISIRNQAARLEAAANQQDFTTLEMNRRIGDCLNVVTDQQMPPNPQWWWQWWNDYNEVFIGSDKQMKVAYVAEQISISAPPPRASDCLVAGTLVWTGAGLQPVETIQAGDLVLSQNIETGELAYKPVLRTTVRPAGPLVRLEASGETIRSSGGHLFWVTGEGWVKARNIRSGAVLHGLEAPVSVGETAIDADQETYNLEVADFHSYFITEQKLLSHDNTVRQPTQAIVPGLVP